MRPVRPADHQHDRGHPRHVLAEGALADGAEQAGDGVGEPGAGDLGADEAGGLGREGANPVPAGRAASLAPADAQLGERGQLGRCLDALGEQPGVDAAGELAEHLGQRDPHRVGVGVADERPVQLDDLRPQDRELLQAE